MIFVLWPFCERGDYYRLRPGVLQQNKAEGWPRMNWGVRRALIYNLCLWLLTCKSKFGNTRLSYLNDFWCDKEAYYSYIYILLLSINRFHSGSINLNPIKNQTHNLSFKSFPTSFIRFVVILNEAEPCWTREHFFSSICLCGSFLTHHKIGWTNNPSLLSTSANSFSNTLKRIQEIVLWTVCLKTRICAIFFLPVPTKEDPSPNFA